MESITSTVISFSNKGVLLRNPDGTITRKSHADYQQEIFNRIKDRG